MAVTDFAQDQQRLVQALDTAGLRHEVRVDGAGRPYAAFSVTHGARTPVALTARLVDEVFEATVHDLPPPASEPDLLAWLDAASESWGMGRVVATADQPGVQVVLGVHVGAAPGSAWPAGAVVGEAIAAAEHILAGRLPDWGAPDAPGLPPLELEGVARLLRACDFEPQARPDGSAVGFAIFNEAEQAFKVEAYLPDAHTVALRGVLAAPVAADRARILAANAAVNRSVGVGACLFDESSARPYYLVHLPVAWMDLLPATIDWHVGRLVGALEAIDRRLASGSGSKS